MLVLLFTSILALLFSHLESAGKMKYGLLAGMSLVTVIAAIRYYVGSDYPAYSQMYMDFIQYNYSIDEILLDEVRSKNEPGWLLTMSLFKPFGEAGFYMMVAAVAVFQGVVIYRIIKKYLPSSLYVFALFIYLFNTSIYVGSLSGMRQHFAVAIIACALPLIMDRKWLYALLVILIASTIHHSAAIFIPFAFWGFIPNNQRMIIIIYSVVFVVLFVSKSYVQGILDLFLKIDNFQDYQFYIEEDGQQSYGLGFLVLSLLPFCLSLIFLYTNQNNELFKIVALASITFVMIPISTSVHLTGRIAYYFEIFSIISIPYCFSIVKHKSIKMPLIVLFVVTTVYSYYKYFHSEIRYESTYFYHSIFELLF